MAKKIKRCLYIGLGGTGIKTILQTKKKFIDTYGEVPPMIGFLGIDTDGGEYSNKLLSDSGEEIELDRNEQLQLFAPGTVEFYKNHKSDFSWVPECNLNTISMLRDLGTGQLRSNGRLAFTVNKTRVVSTINAKMADITNARIVNDDNYELFNIYELTTEVHIVFSLCGGTGSGIFLNMAYLLKEINPNLKIYGYAVLPGVFETWTACTRVAPNAYGALLDLYYLMHNDFSQEPLELKYIGESYNITTKPFDNVIFIDNENDGYVHYDHVGKLTEMISINLAAAACEPDCEPSLIDTMRLSQHPYSWASSMGACEIVYKGEVLSEIYQMKAAHTIIDRMFNTCADADIIANAWIDSAEVHIRENNGQDHVTDYIAPKEPRYALILEKANYKDPSYAVNTNIIANRLNGDEIDEKIETLRTKVCGELRNLLIANINKECGVALAKNILEEIRVQIGLCLAEMKQEKEELTKMKASLKTYLEVAVADLKEYANRIFPIPTRSGREQRAENVAWAVRQYNICLIDIQRHDAAITFYNSVLVILGENETRIANIESLLRAVKKSLSQRIALLQNGVDEDETIFQINLASEYTKCVVVKPEDIRINEFISTLSGDWKVYGFTDYSAYEIEKLITNYTEALPGAKKYRERSIEEILEDIYKKDPALLKYIIQLTARKALPFLHLNQPPIIDDIFVHAGDSIAALIKDNVLLSNPNSNIYFTHEHTHNRIIIHHKIHGIPLHASTDFNVYKKKYESAHPYIRHHFDADIYERIKSELDRENYVYSR